jgi:Pro-kumamolisin, activation domain
MKRVSMKFLFQPFSGLASSAAVYAAITLGAAIFGATIFGAAVPSIAQAPVPQLHPRISGPIDNSSRATLTGSRPPRALAADDIGAVPNSLPLQGMSLVFSRSAAQQAALDTLVAAQQNPSSPLYHHWITPDQYAAQFGVADSDIAAAETWLEQQGFSVDRVSRSRNRIFFSGNAGQVAAAFGAPLHYYRAAASGTQPALPHFAPSADLTLPSALASVVLAVGNLDDFRLRPHIVRSGPQGAQPRFTSSQTGNHFLTPGDLATIYDITPAYNSGYTGTGQSIAVVGQSAVELSDIANFQSAVGITGSTPIVKLVPGSGTSTVDADGNEAESDLDLEYSSTIAKGAQVYFVYTGNSPSYGVFNSIEYAVEQDIAPIISTSYGECEPELGQSEYTTLNNVLGQAAAQGQTVVAAAGDDGSTDCYGGYGTRNVTGNEQLAVDFPGSSQYVTSMGGTEFPAADVASGNNTYFEAASGTDVISSATSYIPEMVWNDDTSAGAADPTEPLSAGGGGVSIFTTAVEAPWQTGTIGGVAIPTHSNRMVPDIALTASPLNAPFAFCTSDTTFWNTAANGGTAPYQQASCNDGLRDSATGVLTVGGGTSFDAPTFSGLVAILNQAKGYSSGQGVVNTTLYSLAATSVYATAFHDITLGGNQCTVGSAYCSSPGTTDYAATTGYDEASGLGSIDFYNLLTAWPANTGTGSTGSGTGSFALTATPVSLAPGASATGTLTVTPASGFTGTVNLQQPNFASLTDGCVVLSSNSVAVTGTTPATVTYTVYTSSTACSAAGAARPGAGIVARNSTPPPPSPWKRLPLPATLAGAFLFLCARRRSRRFMSASLALGLLLTLSLTGLGLTGCSGSSSSTSGTGSGTTTSTTSPAGTYTITITGTDSVTPTLTSTASFNVTVT